MKNRIILLLMVWLQSLSQAVEGQVTTVLPAPPAASSSDAALIARSTVPASFVGLALLMLSAV